MIMYSTRARIAGSAADAVAWAQEIAELVRKKTGMAVDVAARLGGHQDIIWVSRYDSLVDMEKAVDKMQGDPDYQASVKKVTEKGLFDIGSVETAIWRTF
jgi:hypothetical protein